MFVSVATAIRVTPVSACFIRTIFAVSVFLNGRQIFRAVFFILVSATKRLAFCSNCWRRAMQRRRNRKPGMIRSSRQGHQTAAAPTRLYVRQGDPGSEKTQMAAPEGGYHDGMSKDTAYGEMLTCDSRSFRRASCAAPKPGGQLHISKSAELIRHCRRGSRGWNCGLPCKNSPGGASAASAPPIGGAWSPDSGRVSGGARQPTMLASR